MIKYNLRCNSNLCANREPFDGWFENIQAYEDQKRKGFYLVHTVMVKRL